MSDDGVNHRDIDEGTEPDDAQLEELFRLVAVAFAESDPAPPVAEGGILYVRWASQDADLGVMFEAELEHVREDGDLGDDLEFVGALLGLVSASRRTHRRRGVALYGRQHVATRVRGRPKGCRCGRRGCVLHRRAAGRPCAISRRIERRSDGDRMVHGQPQPKQLID